MAAEVHHILSFAFVTMVTAAKSLKKFCIAINKWILYSLQTKRHQLIPSQVREGEENPPPQALRFKGKIAFWGIVVR